MAALLAPPRRQGLLVGLGRPALPLAARGRGDRVDRLVVLLHRARQPPRSRRRSERDAARGVGGEVVGDPRRRLLPGREVPVAPETLPEPLYWFKWEAYTTWLSGFALLVVVYYAHASTFLVDRSVADLDDWRGDRDLDRRPRARVARLRRPLPRCSGATSGCSRSPCRGFVVLAAWGAAELFAPRAAYIQVGAMLGTIMVAQRLLRDHPGALGARPREAGGPRARPALERAAASSARCTTTT